MRKIVSLLMLLLLPLVTACESSKKISYLDFIAVDEYGHDAQNESIGNFFNKGYKGLLLYYEKLENAYLIKHSDYYFIYFDDDTIYIFDNNQVLINSEEELNEVGSANDLYQFINIVENNEDIKFRKVDYRWFEIAVELTKEDYSKILSYKATFGGPKPSHAKLIEIPTKNLNKFPITKEIYEDLSNYEENVAKKIIWRYQQGNSGFKYFYPNSIITEYDTLYTDIIDSLDSIITKLH